MRIDIEDFNRVVSGSWIFEGLESAALTPAKFLHCRATEEFPDYYTDRYMYVVDFDEDELVLAHDYMRRHVRLSGISSSLLEESIMFKMIESMKGMKGVLYIESIRTILTARLGQDAPRRVLEQKKQRRRVHFIPLPADTHGRQPRAARAAQNAVLLYSRVPQYVR